MMRKANLWSTANIDQKYNDIPKLKQNIFGYLYPFNEIQKEESTQILFIDFNSIINYKFIWVHKLSL